MPEPIVFSGIAQLRQGLAGPLPCELRGSAAAPENLPLLLRFALRGTVTLPAQLQDARLDCTGPDACGLSARNLPQAVPVSAAMLHRDAESLAEKVIPPRKLRWRTRLFWRLVFLLMSFPAGRALLLRRYQN